MMQAYTEEQRAELIAELKAEKAVLEEWRDDWNARDKVNHSAICIALAALTAKPVGYGIQRKDDATFGSWLKPKHLVKEDLIYRPAPLYTMPPVAAPVVPAGWKIVPVEPTDKMIIDGFESVPDEFWSEAEEWKKYQAMSGCEQEAHKARLCWAAMVAAAPEVRALQRCAAARDGECNHAQCPQLHDGEPKNSGRHCPIENWDEDD